MKTIQCGICNDIAELQIQIKTRQFRGEDFTINEHYYKCRKCKEEFTTTGLDELNIMQVYDKYNKNI